MSESGPQYGGMGTTVVAALVSGSTLTYASVGDSRMYLVNDHAIAQVTGQNGFFLEDHGFEYNVALIGLLLPLLLAGPGPYNVPRFVFKKVPFLLE